jgi:hypothetical protein
MATVYISNTGEQRVEGGSQPWPVGQAADGRTIYSDGSMGWTTWKPIGTVQNPSSTANASFSPTYAITYTPSSMQDVNAALSQITQSQTTPVQKSNLVDISKMDWTVPKMSPGDIDKLIQDAYNSPQVVAYYQKLLTESQGDVDRAIKRLEEDYQQGLRYTTEDLTRKTGYTTEDLNSALEQLGVTFPKEAQALVDTLNKRGIGVTQAYSGQSRLAGAGAVYDAMGNIISQGNVGGQAGTEMQQLTEDQALRKEAIQRTADRNLKELGIQAQRDLEKEKLTRQRGEEDITREQQKYQEQLQQQRESEATQKGLQLAQYKQAGDIAQKQLDIAKEQLSKM